MPESIIFSGDKMARKTNSGLLSLFLNDNALNFKNTVVYLTVILCITGSHIHLARS